mgnify:CR=1 FL=1|tara:strand:+ start:338 stop:802 length:465 start_codon:yes stop_codon:yes gene_type:complete
MAANDTQVGGTHYQKSDYQHWDWVPDNRIGYLEGAFTKYLIRWRDKDGIKDLNKARHFLIKLIEKAEGGYTNKSHMMSSYAIEVSHASASTHIFLESHNLDVNQKMLCIFAAQWHSVDNLHFILNSFERYFRDCQLDPQLHLGARPAAAPVDPI